MNFEKEDWEWLISIISGIATPFILEWLKAKGLFKRQDQRKQLRRIKSRGSQEGASPLTTSLYHRRNKMKTYDIGFAICVAAGLYILTWDKTAIEALISGIVIGGYIGWRFWHGTR